ncbi:DUF6471 domain-containing protein [Chitinimonas naiadis]
MARRSRDPVVHAMQLKIAAAKASCGYTWQQISVALEACDIRLSPTNLMSKQSRCSFKAKELIVLLRMLEVAALDLSDVEVAGLERAKALLKQD